MTQFMNIGCHKVAVLSDFENGPILGIGTTDALKNFNGLLR